MESNKRTSTLKKCVLLKKLMIITVQLNSQEKWLRTCTWASDMKQSTIRFSNEFSFSIYVNKWNLYWILAIKHRPPIRPIQFQLPTNECVELTTAVQLFWRITFDKAVIYILIFMMDKCDKPGKCACLKWSIHSFSHYFSCAFLCECVSRVCAVIVMPLAF